MIGRVILDCIEMYLEATHEDERMAYASQS